MKIVVSVDRSIYIVMRRLVIAVLMLLSIAASGQAQTQTHAHTKPKLVVGIVVDQMRQEYLYRFESKFSENGFKRFTRDGYMLKNAHYNYVPTETGPGHALVYTGSVPAIS